jgi:hypothetical protein
MSHPAAATRPGIAAHAIPDAALLARADEAIEQR